MVDLADLAEYCANCTKPLDLLGELEDSSASFSQKSQNPVISETVCGSGGEEAEDLLEPVKNLKNEPSSTTELCTEGLSTPVNSLNDTIKFKRALEAVFLHVPIPSTDSLKSKDGGEVDRGQCQGQEKDSQEAQVDKDGLQLCGSCGVILTDLYKLYEEFVQLCKEESVIFKKYVGISKSQAALLEEGHRRVCSSRIVTDYSEVVNTSNTTDCNEGAAFPSFSNRASRRSKMDCSVKLETPSENGSIGDYYGINDSVHVLPDAVKVELDYSESDEESNAFPIWNPEDEDTEGVPYFILPDKKEDVYDEHKKVTEKRATTGKRGRPRKNPEIRSSEALINKRGRPRLNKVHRCPQCGKQAKSRWNLNLHIKSVHEKLRPFQCNFCPRSFFAKPALTSHFHRSHPNENQSEIGVENTGLNTEQVVVISKPQRQFKEIESSGVELKKRRCRQKTEAQISYAMEDYDENEEQETESLEELDYEPVCELGPQSPSSSSEHSSISKLKTSPRKKRGRPPKPKSSLKKLKTYKIHKCPECGKEAKSRWNLNLHIKSVHEKLRPFECCFCLRSFFAKPALKCHIQRFHQNSNGKKSVGGDSKNAHDEGVGEPETDLVKSPQDKSHDFKDSSENAKTLRVRPVPKKSYKLNENEENAPTEDNEMADHDENWSETEQSNPISEVKIKKKRGRPKKTDAKKTADGNDLPKRGRGRPPKLPYEKELASGKMYQCPACDKQSKNRWNLSLHIKCVHQKLKPHECTPCNKKFFSKHAFKMHTRRFHEGDTSAQFACPEPGCGKIFAYPAGLHSHKFSHKPKEEMPFTCDECGNKFKRGCDLLTHKARHSDERPFICDQCGSAFKTSQNLGKHMNSQHRGDQNPQLCTCQICGKVLRNSWNLRLHIRCVHENQKPHQCHICGSSFSSSSNLKVHLRGVHSVHSHSSSDPNKNMEPLPLVSTPSSVSNIPSTSATVMASSSTIYHHQYNHSAPNPNNSFTDLMTSFLNN